MRPFILAAALVLASLPALAQTPPAPPAPAASARPTTDQATGPRYRQTLEQRFESVTGSKDGHLTKAQAEQAHWTYLTRNFDAIDKAHQGYVTVDSIRAYARERRAARQNAAAPAAKSS